MNEEVLKHEKALMKDLMLYIKGVPTEREPLDAFCGPQAAQAFDKAVERKISIIYLQISVAVVITVQLLLPILAFKKTSNVDQFLVENQRTRLRQNYIMQRALDSDNDDKFDITYVKAPLVNKNNPEELPALIVDYANMIRNDIILLDNSVETRTRKRGNIKVEKYDITVLKRRRHNDKSVEELPDELKSRWVAVKKPVTIGCVCTRDNVDFD
ncbi:unnamed protein product [Danaus chrysippus]|uniref:(African queen) hypothetical protein n=1 Tax=Danaus chrysippus TaxID=151541 RepID=A0A8J2VQL7_9NEOP|nr:unnamed protein product [Danaus chrysippus]